MHVGIIGAGISGLGAAWALARRHDVILFEAEDRLGGHSRTIDVVCGDGRTTPVDTGFIVYNEPNYPNLVALFAALRIETKPAPMGFSVSLDGGRLEYAGHRGGLFAQPTNVLKPRFLWMLRDFRRFCRDAHAGLAEGWSGGETLGAFLARKRYSAGFIYDHLLPMAAAIWSAPMAETLAMPVAMFTRFFDNHGLLQLSGRPQWRTVTGGSRVYVRRLMEDLIGRVRVAPGVARLWRTASGVTVDDVSGESHAFDQVVLACHADQALRLIDDQTPAEQSILGAFRFQSNTVLLHQDVTLMPRRRKAWAAWNHLGSARHETLARATTLTYWMNHLQTLDHPDPLLVTLNPAVTPQKLLDRCDLDHPLLDQTALDAQTLITAIQGRDRLWYAGAWLGYGFHEDGLRSGLQVAEALGSPPPWPVGMPLSRQSRAINLAMHPAG